PRERVGRDPLPPGPGPGRRAGHAPAPGALPPRPRHAVCAARPARAGPNRTVDGDRHVPRYGDDLLAPGDRGGAGAGGGAMIVGSALWPCCVTFRPRASHQTALTIFHPCTSFRTLSITYAMMGSRTSMEPKH